MIIKNDKGDSSDEREISERPRGRQNCLGILRLMSSRESLLLMDFVSESLYRAYPGQRIIAKEIQAEKARAEILCVSVCVSEGRGGSICVCV